MLPRHAFDIAFIDGDHAYTAVLRDLQAACELIRDGGILCGDDLELQIAEIDIGYARTQLRGGLHPKIRPRAKNTTQVSP